MKPIKNTEKQNLHPRNPHRSRYDFEQLAIHSPALKNHILSHTYPDGNPGQTINFSNPEAVKALNKALLSSHYNIRDWDIPEHFLCPPIPGRADYIHYLADVLADSNNGIIPQGAGVEGLDIGTGANCIYPIIGNSVYGWHFVGTDIDEKAIQNCKKIIQSNPQLIPAISLQRQTEPRFIFKNIITPQDRFAFTICNPPFHASAAEANKAATRKVHNLKQTRTDKPVLNFGGQNAELWCPRGEIGFLTQMIYESAKYPEQVLWFTTLVSKKENLAAIYRTLHKVGAVTIRTFEMAQGQKTSRMVAWTFLTETQHKNWQF
ncbi:23S rRNA (adenine(1618)-N(6))-methyltransferase RlmF [Flavobacterium humi]|uniref:Ribosomal RNA large subunit methyltransferase F n=1 Tax=Flavobacterium humi TaxID=2562683 RepID=A0A4Z0L9T7_9FLAO|nr:23S rRNA (adenine(1618)-N(6))-methyltransferase RlmF [Flavobacterium humi]TGD59069.1 23S rRNA (adenine(1618)-N(6))-methyltransferase RlmF [Flavobacterium humi]